MQWSSTTTTTTFPFCQLVGVLLGFDPGIEGGRVRIEVNIDGKAVENGEQDLGSQDFIAGIIRQLQREEASMGNWKLVIASTKQVNGEFLSPVALTNRQTRSTPHESL